MDDLDINIYGEAKKEGEEYRLRTEIRGDPPMITGAAALAATGRDTVQWDTRNILILAVAMLGWAGGDLGSEGRGRVRRSYPAPAADCLHCHTV